MSVSEVVKTNVIDGQKGYEEESMGETPPLPEVEEMDGEQHTTNSFTFSPFSFIFVRGESMSCIQFLAVAIITLPVVSTTISRVESFLRSRQVSIRFLRRDP